MSSEHKTYTFQETIPKWQLFPFDTPSFRNLNRLMKSLDPHYTLQISERTLSGKKEKHGQWYDVMKEVRKVLSAAAAGFSPEFSRIPSQIRQAVKDAAKDVENLSQEAKEKLINFK